MRLPSRPSAMARTPAGHAVSFSAVISGIRRCSAFTKAALEKERHISPGTGFPVLCGEPQEAGIRERFGQIAEVDIRLPVAFASECQHCIRTTLDSTFDHSRKVDSEERKTRVRHRINQSAAEMMHVGVEFKVLAAERDDLLLRILPAKACGAVTVQAGAIDDVTDFVSSGCCRDDDATGIAANAGHASIGDDFAIGFLNQFRETLAHSFVVDDSCFRHVNCPDAGDMRFDFQQPIAVDDFAGNSVGLATFVDVVQTRHFVVVQCTMTLPQMSNGMLSRSQNSCIATLPSRQFTARSEPGL